MSRLIKVTDADLPSSSDLDLSKPLDIKGHVNLTTPFGGFGISFSVKES